LPYDIDVFSFEDNEAKHLTNYLKQTEWHRPYTAEDMKEMFGITNKKPENANDTEDLKEIKESLKKFAELFTDKKAYNHQ